MFLLLFAGLFHHVLSYKKLIQIKHTVTFVIYLQFKSAL
ncbi:hypothetical protein C942_03548 [Photobacterium marinum]|uniref:Uncharacterized protein n=1 Tax=Photobacterium marinum TaxID=1056511 RepID=L8J7T5_9GAMM|nr:hypothetical protein C942_03548 [Photobacterium marinum]